MNAGTPNPTTRRETQQEKATGKVEMEDNVIVKMINMLPKNVKGHVVAAAGELVGTFLFLLFGMGALNAVNNAPKQGENATSNLAADSSKLLIISLAFGFSLAINAWVFFRVSGGLFNPAVTLGMWLIGSVSAVRAVIIFIAQIAGGIAASAVVSGLTPGPLTVRTQLGDGTSIVQGLFIEMFLSAELIFTIFMLAAEKHAANFIAPIGIGLALFIAQMFGTLYTGCSCNPTRSFGPDVVVGKFAGYHWIYWVGPGLGALLATAFYKFIKVLEYQTVNAENDSLEVVGRQYDSATGNEKLVTQDGRTIDIPGKLCPDAPVRTVSDDTQVGSESGNAPAVDLEAQKQVNHTG